MLSSTENHRRRRRITLGAVALTALAPLAAACGTAGGHAGAAGSPPTVTIANFSFSPGTLTVHPGQRVTVVNNDPVTHTLTSTTRVFNTGDIPAHTTTSFTAPTAPGRYPYLCLIHQYMTGTLVVS